MRGWGYSLAQLHSQLHKRGSKQSEAMGNMMARICLVLAFWLLGGGVVRLGLDWADSYPYSSASEVRYGIVAFLALSIAISGTVSALRWKRGG